MTSTDGSGGATLSVDVRVERARGRDFSLEAKFTAPPGVTLEVANDGRLERIGSGHGQTIVVRGVPLNSKNFRLQGDEVASELAQPFVVAGAPRVDATVRAAAIDGAARP